MIRPYRFSVESLHSDYQQAFARSHALFCSGRPFFPNGVSQVGRYYRPFPIFIEAAKGAELHTADGKALVDLWQGHFANIFGHHPAHITEAFATANPDLLLQLGCNTLLEQQVASELCRMTGTDQALFCTTGAQATMLATLIGFAHTRRSLVLKIQGGWHGVQPWSLVAVKSPGDCECAGLPASITHEVLAVPFNDIEALNNAFRTYGAEIGVVVAELVLGNAGMEMATREFIQCLRDNCDRFGSMLVFDEIVTGFRCNPGPLSVLYDVKPDLATFGKAISGGMPFAAIVGHQEFFRTVRVENLLRVVADAGTFTSHPGTLVAVLSTLREIAARGDLLYAGIAQLTRDLRSKLRATFDKWNVQAHITGRSPDTTLPDFPVATVRFLKEGTEYDSTVTLSHWDNSRVDIPLRDELSRLALCLRGVFPWQGAGVITAAHTHSHVQLLIDAYEDWLSTWSEV
jgi:glutamate-1-semialdehyde 2,1-aminomutase